MSKVIHHTCPTWGTTNCHIYLLGSRKVKTSYRWDQVNCPNCLKERPAIRLSEFEKWWDEFAVKRLAAWPAIEKAGVCGIAKDAWNNAIKAAVNGCESASNFDGADTVRRLKA